MQPQSSPTGSAGGSAKAPRRCDWPFGARGVPPECNADLDAATWYAIRTQTNGELPRQPLDEWVREQRARTSRAVLDPEPLTEQEHWTLMAEVAEALRGPLEHAPATASAIDELRDLLGRVAGEAPGRDPGIATFTAWAIDHEPRLEGLDRADAHRRLGQAVAHAKQLHARTVAA
jgi:hypothetical protein